MPHLEPGVLRRILSGESGSQEVEAIAEHTLSCDRCRALAGTLIAELRTERPGLRGEGSLQLVFELIDREHQGGVEALLAFEEWTGLRRLSSRRSQRDRVRMTKACHTIPFFRLLLSEIKETPAWEESEFVAALAFLSLDAMSQRQLTLAAKNDLQGEVWAAVANRRRRAAEWTKAHQALANAERHLKAGTGDRRLQAEFLSISASTLADEGQVSKALEALEKCRAIYRDLSEWTLLARALVQTANILEPVEPAKGLAVLDDAVPWIPAEDSYLTLLAELLRVECLIGACRPNEALRVFLRCSPLLIANPRARMRIRGTFSGARLLDALGFGQKAERLLEEVVNRDIEHELYKDAFLDLLYLYGHHAKAGDLEKAARVCRRALTDATLAAIAHDQLRTLWEQLLETTRHQAVSQDLLRELRQYLGAHWKHPADKPPRVAFP